MVHSLAIYRKAVNVSTSVSSEAHIHSFAINRKAVNGSQLCDLSQICDISQTRISCRTAVYLVANIHGLAISQSLDISKICISYCKAVYIIVNHSHSSNISQSRELAHNPALARAHIHSFAIYRKSVNRSHSCDISQSCEPFTLLRYIAKL
jgi:hypothetical protein